MCMVILKPDLSVKWGICGKMSFSIETYKFNLCRELINSPEIVRGIDSSVEDVYVPDDLNYKNIFPYIHVDKTQTLTDCYILFDVDFPSINKANQSFSEVRLVMWILCHIDKIKFKGYNGTRIDFLADEVGKLLDGSKEFGAGGKLEMLSNVGRILNDKYLYRELQFRTTELRPYTDNKIRC